MTQQGRKSGADEATAAWPHMCRYQKALLASAGASSIQARKFLMFSINFSL